MALSSQDRTKIATLLSHGVQQSVVAASIGLSQGRLTQLISSDLALQEEIGKAQSKVADKEVTRDQRLEHLEEQLLATLPAHIEEASSLSEAVGALRILSDMRQRRKAVTSGQSNVIGAGLELQLSGIANAKISVTLTPEKRIIELGGRTMLPMDRDKAEEYLSALPSEVKHEPSAYDPDEF